MEQFIYLSLVIASVATYLCRALGVKLSNKISIQSRFFDWIECISIGIIIAVISKIIFFPEGILKETYLNTRVTSIFILLVLYYIFKKNILISLVLTTIVFTSFHNMDFILSYFREFSRY